MSLSTLKKKQTAHVYKVFLMTILTHLLIKLYSQENKMGKKPKNYSTLFSVNEDAGNTHTKWMNQILRMVIKLMNVFTVQVWLSLKFVYILIIKKKLYFDLLLLNQRNAN